MKFQISRTSVWNGKPCDDAKKETLTRLDWRTFKSLDEVRKAAYAGVYWLEEGSNHREENGMVVRELEQEVWTIEINSLEELLNLSDSYGPLVFESATNEYKPSLGRIEIYDDYRE
jgi:hypothetical protein